MKTAIELELPTAVVHYFDALNSQNFHQAAKLFIESGALVAPLGKCIRGRTAIFEYLADQCNGMTFCPEAVKKLDKYMVVVEGLVHCLAFQVRIRWSFYLSNDALAVVKVELLTKLTQLGHLQNSKYAS